MRIGILPVDSKYPNLALMKVAGYHKAEGDSVEMYSPFTHYDKVYASKIFTFTADFPEVINADEVERGGTGYDIAKVLPPAIDNAQPKHANSIGSQARGATFFHRKQ